MSSLSTNFGHVAFCRNEELNTKLKHEIQKLNRMVANPGANTLGSEGDSSEVNELRVRQITYSAEKKNQRGNRDKKINQNWFYIYIILNLVMLYRL